MLRTGSICVSFIYNYLVSEMKTTKTNDDLVRKSTKLKCLSNVFADSGGVLSKLSQLLSYEEGDLNNTVFSECKPFNEKQTREFIFNEITNNPEFFKNVKMDLKGYKSGSVGIVYKGVYKNEKDIVMKVQYVGLKKQFKTDISILNSIIHYLYDSDLSVAMTDIEEKLYEELDYNNEKNNQQLMYNIWKNSDIKIAEIIEELCTDKLLTMNFIKGVSLPVFIANSTQDERNFIGAQIVRFIFTSMYKHNVFYSDIHYGNFIIENGNILHIVDFGSINKVDEALIQQLIDLHKSMYYDDKNTFYQIVEEIGILTDNITKESKDYMYDYFKLQYLPWISDNDFHFSNEYLCTAMVKNIELMKQWCLPPSMIHLNKIPHGLVHILNKLNTTVNFSELFNNILFKA